jgi:hypothetical protein
MTADAPQISIDRSRTSGYDQHLRRVSCHLKKKDHNKKKKI